MVVHLYMSSYHLATVMTTQDFCSILHHYLVQTVCISSFYNLWRNGTCVYNGNGFEEADVIGVCESFLHVGQTSPSVF